MNKLQLHALTVESFDTSALAAPSPGTVAGHEANDTLRNCPVSYGGTCVISACRTC